MSWLRGPYSLRSLTVLSLVAALGLVAAGVVLLRCWPPPAAPNRPAPPAGAAALSIIVPRQEGEPPNPWDTPGAHWRLRVKQHTGEIRLNDYGPPEKDKVQLEMYVDVLVLPPRHLGDRKIVRLQFTPNAPENPNQTFYYDDMKQDKWVLELDRASGQVEGVRTQDPKLRDYAWPAVPLQGVMLLRTVLYGFPVGWMTQTSDVAEVPPAKERRAADSRREMVVSFEPTRVPAGLDGSGQDVKAVKATYGERRDLIYLPLGLIVMSYLRSVWERAGRVS